MKKPVKYLGYNGSRYCIQFSFEDKSSCISDLIKYQSSYQYHPLEWVFDNKRFTGNLLVEETESDIIFNITFLLTDDNEREASAAVHKDFANQYIQSLS